MRVFFAAKKMDKKLSSTLSNKVLGMEKFLKKLDFSNSGFFELFYIL
jgi:hypothetical protein